MQCDTLKGLLQDIELAVLVFDAFATVQRAPGIHLFDQESVHRYGIGCSTYPGLEL